MYRLNTFQLILSSFIPGLSVRCFKIRKQIPSDSSQAASTDIVLN